MNNYRVTYEGRTIGVFPSEADAWAYLLGTQSGSVFYAVTFGGYDVIYPNRTTLSDTYGKAGA